MSRVGEKPPEWLGGFLSFQGRIPMTLVFPQASACLERLLGGGTAASGMDAGQIMAIQHDIRIV